MLGFIALLVFMSVKTGIPQSISRRVRPAGVGYADSGVLRRIRRISPGREEGGARERGREEGRMEGGEREGGSRMRERRRMSLVGGARHGHYRHQQRAASTRSRRWTSTGARSAGCGHGCLEAAGAGAGAAAAARGADLRDADGAGGDVRPGARPALPRRRRLHRPCPSRPPHESLIQANIHTNILQALL